MAFASPDRLAPVLTTQGGTEGQGGASGVEWAISDRTLNATELLLAWGRGDVAAFDRLVPLVHDELRRLARRYMRDERSRPHAAGHGARERGVHAPDRREPRSMAEPRALLRDVGAGHAAYPRRPRAGARQRQARRRRAERSRWTRRSCVSHERGAGPRGA